jgi:hypothetical protein
MQEFASLAGKTFCLIKSPHLFRLFSVLSFGSDLPFDTLEALDSVPNQSSLDLLKLNGKHHLALLGCHEVDPETLNQIETLLGR